MADYHHRFEPILYGWLPDGAHYFIEDRRQDDVFEIDKPHVNDQWDADSNARLPVRWQQVRMRVLRIIITKLME
jgi:hypothetical protein